MADSYYTISSAGTGVFKDRGSKFIGMAYPVSNEQEIKAILNELKKTHPAARHFCYAWRLGADMQSFRMNDDGEPSHTAGKPIFGQIQNKNLTNVLIVVIRYFGGTLLGTNGLIQAYKSAAASAIENTEILEKFIYIEFRLKYQLEDVNKVMKVLKDLDAEITKQEYTNSYEAEFRIKKLNEKMLIEKLKHLYNCELKQTGLI